MTPTIHFVYPRDPARHASPWCIGNELGDRLAKRYPMRYHDWRERGRIEPAPGDILLGHPHRSRRSIFRASLDHPNFSRRLLLAPYVGDTRQAAFHDQHIDRCDLFLAITGGHWFRHIGDSPMARWLPKMRHLDLAVNRDHFPWLGRELAPPGQRRFVYIGHTAHGKNTGFLGRIAEASPETPIAWIGQGRKPIAGVQPLGFVDFRTDAGRATLASHDFMITVGRSDGNPTTILEALSWGLIPVCTPTSGYEGTPGIVNVPLDDVPGAVAVLRHLQHCPTEALQALQAQGQQQLREHFHWDRFAQQVIDAIESTDSPPLRPRTLTERLHLGWRTWWH